MILTNQNENSVVSHGVKSTSNFNILLNGKAFRILSDSIYQDKIGSIVREISTNAYDSHVMANKKDVAFLVHVPSSMEPWFSVKDFGVGLSHEEMVNTYTTLFASTKDLSNETVGAFGLGSKTPFCYSDSFTVIATKDGVQRSYDARLDAGGIPTLALMSEIPTDECNGLEVIVAVNDGDFDKFSKAISSQLTFFPTRPTILNKTGFKFEIDNLESDRLYGNDDYSIYKTDAKAYYGDKGKTYIVQGGVGYPLDINKLNDYSLNDKIQSLVGQNRMILFFNIGSIAVTTSREAISYDATTIKNIIDKIAVVRASMRNDIEKKINSINNAWNRVIFINNLDNDLLETLELKVETFIPNFIKDGYNWGLSFNKDNSTQDSPLFCLLNIEVPDKVNGVQQLDANGMPLQKIIQKRFARYALSELNGKYNYASSVNAVIPKANVEIFFKDCSNASKRVREYRGSNDIHVYLIGNTYKDNAPDIAAIEKLLDRKIRLASSLPNPDAVVKDDGTVLDRAPVERAKYYSSSKISYSKSKSECEKVTDEWDDILKNKDVHYYYVVENYSLTDFTINIPGNAHCINQLLQIINPNEINYIAERHHDKVKNLSNWIDLSLEIPKKHAQIIEENKDAVKKLALQKARSLAKATVFSDSLDEAIEWKEHYVKDNDLKKAHVYSRLIEKYQLDKEVPYNIRYILQHAYEAKINELTEKYKAFIVRNDNKPYIATVKERYKLFTLMKNASSTDAQNMKDDINHYVRGVQMAIDNAKNVV